MTAAELEPPTFKDFMFANTRTKITSASGRVSSEVCTAVVLA